MSSAFLFPGQGSQHVGMGLELYNQSPEARAVFDQADELLGFPLSQLCFIGPEADLIDTVNQQPAIFTASMAVWCWMQANGWEMPAYVAGHSLGEFSALAAAGAISFADGLRLVRRRGELMKAAGIQSPGAMAAILGLDMPVVQQICQEATERNGRAQHSRAVQVANDNCPGQVVISGDAEALELAMTLAEEAKARKVVRLPISIAAHSPLMASAVEPFAEAINATPMKTAQCPIIGNVTARPLTSPEDIRTELKEQLTAGVAWTASINYLLAEGVDTFVEVGPGDTLLSFVKRIDRNAKRVKP
jgi:[acyl-carrier-protein] S-malonyltransferase